MIYVKFEVKSENRDIYHVDIAIVRCCFNIFIITITMYMLSLICISDFLFVHIVLYRIIKILEKKILKFSLTLKIDKYYI